MPIARLALAEVPALTGALVDVCREQPEDPARASQDGLRPVIPVAGDFQIFGFGTGMMNMQFKFTDAQLKRSSKLCQSYQPEKATCPFVKVGYLAEYLSLYSEALLHSSSDAPLAVP